MSREIKFRAWDIGNKVWVCNPIYISRFGKIINASGDNITKNIVLLQFTGLLDKNRKEIYEGDIVLCKDDGECFPEEYSEDKDEYIPVGKYEVVYQAEHGYAAFELKDSPCEEMNGLAYACANSIEVIGNIYENPNLLNPPTQEIK